MTAVHENKGLPYRTIEFWIFNIEQTNEMFKNIRHGYYGINGVLPKYGDLVQ